MARLLGALALIASCVAVALTSATASASAPSPPRNCGPPVTGSPTNSTVTALIDPGATESTIVVSGLASNIADVDVITNIPHSRASDIDSKKLVAGSYRATITATAPGAATASAAKTVRFRISKAK